MNFEFLKSSFKFIYVILLSQKPLSNKKLNAVDFQKNARHIGSAILDFECLIFDS